jgi:hypothetical protein
VVRRVLYSVVLTARSREQGGDLDMPDIDWTLDHVRKQIKQGLPLVPLFNTDVI